MRLRRMARFMRRLKKERLVSNGAVSWFQVEPG